jgi:hypothetical protein
MKQVIKISQVKNNPNNPRVIKDHDFYVLVNSIKTTPGFMEFRPVIIDYNNMVLCGNQRLRACIYLGHKEIWTDLFTQEKADEMNKEAQKEGRPTKTYLEYCKAITIVDNTHAGTWDWDMLANEWDSVQLAEWSLEVWQPQQEVSNVNDYSLNTADEKLNRFLDAKIKNITIPFENEEFGSVVDRLEKLLLKYNCEDYRALIYKILENEKV